MQKRTSTYGCVSEGDGERAGGSGRRGHGQRRPKDGRGRRRKGRQERGREGGKGDPSHRLFPVPDPRPTGDLVHEREGGVAWWRRKWKAAWAPLAGSLLAAFQFLKGAQLPPPQGPCPPVRSPLGGCLSSLLSCPVHLPGVWAGTRAAPYPWRPPAGGEALGLPLDRQTWIQTSGLLLDLAPTAGAWGNAQCGKTPGRDLCPCQGLRSVLPSGLNRGGRDSASPGVLPGRCGSSV